MDTKKVLSAAERLSALFDGGSFTEVGALAVSNGEPSGVVCGYGYVGDNPVYAFAQDRSVRNGALTREQAEKIVKVYDLASKTGLPIVGIYDSYGADISDTVGVLESYGKWMKAAAAVSGVVPQISVIAGACAATSAMIAVSADFVIMQEDAELFVTPNTDDKELSKTAAENGTAALICKDYGECVSAARELLLRLPQNNLSGVPMFDYEEPKFNSLEDAQSAAESLLDKDSVKELYSDYGRSAYTALATLNGASVGVVATNKTEKKLTADDALKLARFVRTCDAFSLPIITLVDTRGFCRCVNDQRQGAVKLWSRVAGAYSEATTIKLAAVIGKAYGPAFMALAGKGADSDIVIACDSAVISSVEPATAVEFLWHDKLKGAEDLSKERAALAREYVKENATAQIAAEKMCVDIVTPSAGLRASLINGLEMLAGKRVTNLPKKHSNGQL